MSQLDVFADEAAQDFFHVGDDAIQVDDLGLQTCWRLKARS